MALWVCVRIKEYRVGAGKMEKQQLRACTADSKKGEVGLLLPESSGPWSECCIGSRASRQK